MASKHIKMIFFCISVCTVIIMVILTFIDTAKKPLLMSHSITIDIEEIDSLHQAIIETIKASKISIQRPISIQEFDTAGERGQLVLLQYRFPHWLYINGQWMLAKKCYIASCEDLQAVCIECVFSFHTYYLSSDYIDYWNDLEDFFNRKI